MSNLGAHSDRVASRATVMQQKTRRTVQFEITESTREAVAAWIAKAGLGHEDFLFPSRLHDSPHLSTRQYARIVDRWVRQLDLDPTAYGTHTMRRTKASLIYRRTHNLRAVQLLLGHSKLESTVRYLGIEVDDALEMAIVTFTSGCLPPACADGVAGGGGGRHRRTHFSPASWRGPTPADGSTARPCACRGGR